MKPAELLLVALRDVDQLSTPEWDLRHWDLLLRQARRAELLASLALLVQERGLLERVPAQPRRHLEWAARGASQHAQSVRREVEQIQAAVQGTGQPLVPPLQSIAWLSARSIRAWLAPRVAHLRKVKSQYRKYWCSPA
jgi:hypothetical protein